MATASRSRRAKSAPKPVLPDTCRVPFPRELAGQGLRFLLIGGGTTVLQLILVWWLTPSWGGTRAFVAAWALCTLLSTIGHRYFTFRRHHRARFDQTVGYITALASLGLNTGALAILQPEEGWQGAAIVLAINTALGIARFVILRLWFTGRARHEIGEDGPA